MSAQKKINAECKEPSTYGKVSLNPLFQYNIDFRGPKDWDGYPSVPHDTRKAMQKIISPRAYVKLHYDEATFACFKYSSHGKFPAARVTYVQMNQDGVITQVDADEELKTCHKMFQKCQEIWKLNETNFCKNIINDSINLANIYGFRVFFKHGRREDGTATIEGVVSYHYYRPEGEETCSYIVCPTDNQYIMLVTQQDQHAEAVTLINKLGKLQKLGKICAYCGSGNNLKKCACRDIRYCGFKCQLQHWKLHKEACSHRAWKMPLDEVENFLRQGFRDSLKLIGPGTPASVTAPAAEGAAASSAKVTFAEAKTAAE